MCPVSGGVYDLYSETRGGQYFVARGREIEGPPPKDVFGSFPNYPHIVMHIVFTPPKKNCD